jgi:phosphate:Na+ symporter
MKLGLARPLSAIPTVWLVPIGVATLLLLSPSGHAAESAAEISWFDLAMGLFGGLSFFLYGMDRMGEALKAVAGDRMRDILGALSNNRIVGLLTGTFVTAIIQSSSVTTVMLVGFVSAGLMTLPQTIGVILGADIGTTVTAQIVSLKVTKYALLLVSVGFITLFLSRKERRKQVGYAIMGLGLIFFGMTVMGDAMRPLRTYPPFIDMMSRMDSPALAILVSTVFTGLVQSSSATMGVIIVLATQGLISLDAGIALALGANIGTCATAGLAAIGKPRAAVRVVLAHVGFKLLGVAMMFPFIGHFSDLVAGLSAAPDPTLTGTALLAETVPRQVANAHTIFNVGIAVVFLPFTTVFARFLTWLLPQKPPPAVDRRKRIRPKYLDGLLLHTPSLALEASRREVRRMGDRVLEMFEGILPAVLAGSADDLKRLRKLDDDVDELYRCIVEYLGEISKQKLDDRRTRELVELLSGVNDLESIGDLVETDLYRLGRRRLDDGVEISDQTKEVLTRLHGLVLTALRATIDALCQGHQGRARSVIGMKAEVQSFVADAEAHQSRRLVATAPDRLAAYAVEIDIIDKFKRAYYHAKRIAKAVQADDEPLLPYFEAGDDGDDAGAPVGDTSAG